MWRCRYRFRPPPSASTRGRVAREAVLARCRQERIEPPGRVERIVVAARTAATTAFCARTVERLPAESVRRLERLAEPSEGWRGALAELKAGPGAESADAARRDPQAGEGPRAGPTRRPVRRGGRRPAAGVAGPRRRGVPVGPASTPAAAAADPACGAVDAAAAAERVDVPVQQRRTPPARRR